MKYIVSRDVTQQECSWLNKDVKQDEIVYDCLYATYGVVTNSGIAVTYNKSGDYPFFELPMSALHESK